MGLSPVRAARGSQTTRKSQIDNPQTCKAKELKIKKEGTENTVRVQNQRNSEPNKTQTERKPTAINKEYIASKGFEGCTRASHIKTDSTRKYKLRVLHVLRQLCDFPLKHLVFLLCAACIFIKATITALYLAASDNAEYLSA